MQKLGDEAADQYPHTFYLVRNAASYFLYYINIWVYINICV